MVRKLLFFLFAASLIGGLVSPGFALEKFKLGGAVRESPTYYLPPLAAEEKGFWKENGLEVEWVPFVGGAPHIRALVAGVLNMGMGAAFTMASAVERGAPLIMVGDLAPNADFSIYVRPDSPYRQVRDLKGARIAVSSLGSGVHAYGQILVKAFGIEKDVRFVGAGGSPPTLAALRAGAVEAITSSFPVIASLQVQGIVRELANVDDYVPKPWLHNVIMARKDFAKTKPEVVKRVIKAILQANDLIRKDPRWAIDKMKNIQGFSEEAAKQVHDKIPFSLTGKIDRKAVENIRRVFIEYGILSKEKAPAVDDLFTNEYLPG